MLNILTEKLEVTIEEGEIKTSFRIGKIKEDNNGQPRPIKVVLQNSEKKKEIFHNLHKLNTAEEEGDGDNKLHVVHDLTAEQRKLRKELEDRAQDMSQRLKEPYRVRGPPWAWYIKRIAK